MTDIEAMKVRALKEIAAAKYLAEGGFDAQAISRAYYATFYAAEAALRPSARRARDIPESSALSRKSS